MKKTFNGLFRVTMRPLYLIIVILCLSSCRSINTTALNLELPRQAVVFSFDDGPNTVGDTTARVLDMLRTYDIQAMFCLLGVNVENAPALVRRIYDEGHIIVNHGYSDKWAYHMTNNEFRENLLKGDAAINAALGHDNRPRLYRPHGGYYRPSHEKILRDEGYTVVSCNIRAYDAVLTKSDQDRVVRDIVGKIKKQGAGIILLHDARDSHERMEKNLEKQPNGAFDRSWIPDTAEIIIVRLLENGYIFEKPVYAQK
jgi:peptidoglycan/xylan/chitin deacetylase (PgdA/CDA1 family)